MDSLSEEPTEDETKEHPNNKNIVIVGGKYYWKDTGILITRRDIRRAKYRGKRKQKRP